MGMFDHYVPVPTLHCPLCGAALDNWQGKDGPCVLEVWKQAESAPNLHFVDDEWTPPAHILKTIPPPGPTLNIYALCKEHGLIDAECLVENGIWTKTTVTGVTNANAPARESP